MKSKILSAKDYDLEIAKCNGNKKKLRDLKYTLEKSLESSSLISRFLSKKDNHEVFYLISAIYKEIGLYESSIKRLKLLHKENKSSNFILISLLSALKKYSSNDSDYHQLINLFNSRLTNNNFYYNGSSPQKIIEIIKKNGFVILKDFFNKEIINELKNNLESNIINSEKILKNIGKDPNNCIYPLYMITNYETKDISKKIQTAYEDNWHLTKYFNNHDISYINNMLVEPFKNSFLNEVIGLYTKNTNWKLHNDYSMSRKISHYGFEKDGYAALHQDSRLQLFYKHYLTFWIPFCKTGNGSAPTMDVIPTYCRNFYPYEYFQTDENIQKRQLSVSDFPKECILSPEVNVGDVWIHDSFTLHGTSVTENNYGSRHSIDLRFF
tara:strand:- start:2075 stop:3217 length:1143 start_codon:yes stop_codon:yes gene_type:complete